MTISFIESYPGRNDHGFSLEAGVSSYGFYPETHFKRNKGTGDHEHVHSNTMECQGLTFRRLISVSGVIQNNIK